MKCLFNKMGTSSTWSWIMRMCCPNHKGELIFSHCKKLDTVSSMTVLESAADGY